MLFRSGALVVDLQAGTDVLRVNDSGDTAGNTGNLTITTVTGLGMGAPGISYANVETLNIDLGTGAGLTDRVVQLIGSGAALPVGHPAAGKTRVDGKATAYVCTGQSCSLPVHTAEELSQLLRAA